MSWADTATAKALAVLAEPKATARRIFTGTPSNWNRSDVWLTRTVTRDRSPESPIRDPATPTRHLPPPATGPLFLGILQPEPRQPRGRREGCIPVNRPVAAGRLREQHGLVGPLDGVLHADLRVQQRQAK